MTIIDLAKTVSVRGVASAKSHVERIGARLHLDPSDREVLDALHDRGYYVIEGYYDDATCAQLRAELDRIARDYAPRIWIDESKCDHRAYGANEVSDLVRRFTLDPLVQRLADAYMNEPQICFFTLAAHALHTEPNRGSGQGWHRDTAASRQFKAMIYLSDVTEDSGAFEYVPYSHRLRFLLKTVAQDGVKFGQHRLDGAIDRITARSPTKIFSARRGTMIFFDSSGIHRGRPLREGERYAMTNYFFPAGHIEELKATDKFTRYFVARASPQ